MDTAHSAVIRGIKWLDSGLLVSVGGEFWLCCFLRGSFCVWSQADAKIMVWQMHSSPGEDEMVSPDFDRKRLLAKSASVHSVL